MLPAIFKSQLQLGFAQAAASALLALIVVGLAQRRGIRLAGEASIAMVRGLVQIVAVGSILVILLRGPKWTGGLLLAAMIVAAGATSARRAKGIPTAFKVSAYSIACGAGPVIAVMTWLGVIDTAITAISHTKKADFSRANCPVVCLGKSAINPTPTRTINKTVTQSFKKCRNRSNPRVPYVNSGAVPTISKRPSESTHDHRFPKLNV